MAMTPEEKRNPYPMFIMDGDVKVPSRAFEVWEEGYRAAQLLKADNVCPECKDRRSKQKFDTRTRVWNGRTWVVCPTCKGTGKKPTKATVGKVDREKKLHTILARIVTLKSYTDSEFAEIIALLPDMEELDKIRSQLVKLTKKLDDRETDLIEAKREERDRIIGYLRDKYGGVGTNASRQTAYRIAKDLAINLTLEDVVKKKPVSSD